MRHRTAFLVLPLVACTCGPTQPPPGYDGPIPSAEARDALGELHDACFTPGAGALADRTWAYEGFAAIPNPRTGKGPVARVRGEHAGGVAEGVSEAYAEVWC